MQYQLKLQQLVKYARSRIYRQFLNSLVEDTNIRLNGGSYLFYFMVLCSKANFRTSYQVIDGKSFTIAPGEWIITIEELLHLYRKKTAKAVIAVLDHLQEKGIITYTLLCRKNFVRFRITEWSKFNAVVEANAPCTKDDGFFFFPFRMISAFLSEGKVSEMDILLDLWLSTVYNDTNIPASDVGPVVYIRNGTRNPLIGYEELSERWNISKSTTGRILRKFEELGYIQLVSFQSSYGTAIYLKNYLSTMFQISDITIDKEEVAMSLNIKLTIPDENVLSEEENDEVSACQNDEISISDEQIRVPKSFFGVPESHIFMIVKKVVKILYLQGIPCASCARARYILYPLSFDCKSNCIKSELIIRCPDGKEAYRFALDIEKENESEVH